jgi:hypothetical protein
VYLGDNPTNSQKKQSDDMGLHNLLLPLSMYEFARSRLCLGTTPRISHLSFRRYQIQGIVNKMVPSLLTSCPLIVPTSGTAIVQLQRQSVMTLSSAYNTGTKWIGSTLDESIEIKEWDQGETIHFCAIMMSAVNMT